MTLGIIGLGRIGMLFSHVILQTFPDVQILVYSPRKQKRFTTIISSTRVRFTTDWKSFLTETDINGYIIAAPSDTHFDYVKQLATKGKPIFCEKPLDLSLQKINTIQKLTEKK
ncbi:MAG: Gfo/Idh/MocA family oxidoreductase [Saprospiraceae bacterium]|nr:Gfo/Idh/MocA family oxidoreductase [Saprospiraceae bacterium]